MLQQLKAFFSKSNIPAPEPQEILPPQNPVQIRLVKGDITDITCDGMVNASNTHLLPGGGVDGRIHEVAGPRLREACIPKIPCPQGTVAVTPAFNLPATYVIHTVSPLWLYDSDSDLAYRRDMETLQECYRNILVTADKLRLKSIAIPAIGTGANGVPIQVSASIAHAELARYQALQKSSLDLSADTRYSLEEITVVLYTTESYDCYTSEFESDIGASILEWEERIEKVASQSIYTDSTCIALKGNYFVQYVPSYMNKIIITGKAGELEDLVHHPRGERYSIESNTKSFLHIVIASNDLNRLEFEGEGEFEFEDKMKHDFDLSIVGDISVRMKGIIENLSIDCYGDGMIDASELQAKNLVVDQNGSHEIHAKATEDLKPVSYTHL